MTSAPVEKRCNKCGLLKKLSEFHKNSACKDGLHTICKICRAKWGEYYRTTPKGKAVSTRAREKYRKTDKYRESKQREKVKRVQKKGGDAQSA